MKNENENHIYRITKHKSQYSLFFLIIELQISQCDNYYLKISNSEINICI